MHRFDTGGLENGVVNLINHMPADAYRHAVIALTDITDFKNRIQRPDVQFFALNKQPGHVLWIYPQLYRLFRQLKPAIVHTRNLAALEATVPAWAAQVPARIHGEHGRDVGDFDGTNKKCQWIRRIYSPFVKHYIALSQDLAHYLTHSVGIGAKRVTQIYNGVDTSRFHPSSQRQDIPGSPFNKAGLWLVGTAGRMQTVKNQTNLARAFVQAINAEPRLRERLRLVMVGDGPCAMNQSLSSNLRALPNSRGCQGSAKIFLTSCADSTVLSCPRSAKVSPTLSSKPWPAGYP
jgi:sugar transferase (PEP-CTERM/EpsH1 system associated)